jgi:hypothetical protein
MAVKDEQVSAIMLLTNPRTGLPYTRVEAATLYYAASERYRKAKGRKDAWQHDQEIKEARRNGHAKTAGS